LENIAKKNFSFRIVYSVIPSIQGTNPFCSEQTGAEIRQVNYTIISDIENKCDVWLMQDLLKGLVRQVSW